MFSSFSLFLSSAFLLAWSLFSRPAQAEVRTDPVPDSRPLHIESVVSNAVQKAVSAAISDAVAEAATKATKALADATAAREAREAEEKAAREAEKAAVKEAREFAKEDREYADKLEAEKRTLEREMMRRIETRIFKLEHASAQEVADKFNTMWNGDFGVDWKISKMAVAFPESNAIMMTAPRAIILACEQSIQELDVEAPQVYIEARFVELGNSASHRVGIDWSGIAGGTTIGATAGAGLQTTRLGKGVKEFKRETTERVGSKSIKETYGVSGLNGNDDVAHSIYNGTDDAMISYFNGTLNITQMSMTLSALDATDDAKTFSNPKIIVSSGKRATVDMTTKYPNVKISTKRTTGTSDSVDIASNLEAIPGEDAFMFAKEAFFSWGISLEVTPRISTNGLINVSIVPTISSRDGWVQTGTDSADDQGTVSTKYPVIKVQRLISEFNLASGTTAVIGGLSVTEEKQVDTGVLLLKDIPWIGPRLFGSSERVKVQKEIIVFVTVGLVDPRNVSSDAGLPKNAVLGRQYTNGVKLEPGDRPSRGVEGIESLDLRPLAEQVKDPIENFVPYQKEEENKTK